MMKILAALISSMNKLGSKKSWLRISLSLLILVQSAGIQQVQSAFDDVVAGARAPGMADSYVAIADDSSAVLYNPAGLVQMTDGEISTQYGQLLKGLDDGSSFGTTYLGFANPLRRGYKTIGAAYHNFKADNLFSERTIGLSYAQRINAQLMGRPGIMSGGVTLKQLSRQYQPDRFTENSLNDAGTGSNRVDPLFASGYGKAALTADVGLLYQFGPKYDTTAGLAITNVTEPDISLSNTGDRVPRSIKLGGAYRPQWGTLSAELRRTNRATGKADNDLAVGLERNLPVGTLGALVLRGGYASGSRNFKALTAGLGYVYNKFRLDYAFNFPVSNIPDSQGSHRVGFTFRIGNSAGAALGSTQVKDIDLLASFAHDSSAIHILLARHAMARRMDPLENDNLLLLLMRKFPLDDPGLDDIRPQLRDLIRKKSLEVTDWPQLKYYFLKGLPEADKVNANQALEQLVKGDSKSTLARLALLPESTQKGNGLSAVSLMALGELAAQSYREPKLDATIDYVRRMIEILPADEVVMKAYRQLLAERNKAPVQIIRVTEELPDAPQDLVAPKPMGQESVPTKVLAEDITAKNFGNSFGYYLTRKAEGADADELRTLLKQMKSVFGKDMDMTLVDLEMSRLPARTEVDIVAAPRPEEKPAPQTKAEPTTQTQTPVSAPAKTKETTAASAEELKLAAPAKPKLKPVSAPVKSKTKSVLAQQIDRIPELERAWEYYRLVSARDISDFERIEVLEAMLLKFGEKGAAQINKELQRIRRRVTQ